MRVLFSSTVLVSLVCVAAASAGGLALSQPISPGAVPSGESNALSEADRNAAPIPPGRHAALVKKVCLGCHGADLVVGMRYTRDDAERFYKNMVSPDLTTEQAKQIIEYLTTHMGA